MKLSRIRIASIEEPSQIAFAYANLAELPESFNPYKFNACHRNKQSQKMVINWYEWGIRLVCKPRLPKSRLQARFEAYITNIIVQHDLTCKLTVEIVGAPNWFTNTIPQWGATEEYYESIHE